MSAIQSNDEAASDQELRLRLPQQPEKPLQANSTETARQAVIDLNKAEESKTSKDKKTYGRTPDGTVFVVPETHDMVSDLFDPREPKNVSDAIVLAVLSLKVATVVLLPTSITIPVFAALFLFWRAMYNGGIGYVLMEQSNFNSVVAWAKTNGIFEKPDSGNNKYAQYYGLLKRELETKIPKDYKFDEAPLEYNTWLLFRRGVDLILMCDFTSYCCFAAACGGTPPGEAFLMTLLRWVVGIVLILFNLWVKLDAHRVVKDYAWYWGDFFFLIDQELTFDGVFEMAPHPMYSVGYAGFYGISLMAASYKVLFISIIGHAAQFAFLALVENPHIEKTYNPPAPRRRTSPSDTPPASAFDKIDGRDLESTTDLLSPTTASHAYMPTHQQTYVRDIIGLQNIDLHRVIDNSAILLQLYVFALAALTPSTPLYQTIFVLHALIWRLWYSLGIGYILDRQSRKKNWTRHFIKHGETADEAWRQWKGIYHLSMTMCYASFVSAGLKMYHLPTDWEVGFVLLRHVVGFALIALHLWTVLSIYESLGEFGWFFGDFFFDRSAKLTYSGIYRFLNNPERILGLAGVWGVALMTWSKAIFLIALVSHALTLAFIQFVEQPHMRKRYGQRLRQESGVSKTLHRSMPKPLREVESNIDRAIEELVDRIEEQIEVLRPQLYNYLDSTAVWLHSALSRYPNHVNVSRTTSDLTGLERRNYTLEVHGETITRDAVNAKASGRESERAQSSAPRDQQYQPVMLEYGAPIRVKWTAPLNHSKKDWIGLYMIGDNTSREITRVSSQGRWIAVSNGSFESARAEAGILVSDKQVIKWQNEQGEPLMTGEVEFAGDKLWWTTGVFEFRYHHDGKHSVMTTSQPFEVRIGRFEDDQIDYNNKVAQLSIEQAIFPVIRNCFDRDPEIAPKDVEESFGALVEREGKFARRAVYAIWQMFGIELAPAVVKADGNVRKLAWRVCNAKQVLAPYTMSASKGTSTPAEAK